MKMFFMLPVRGLYLFFYHLVFIWKSSFFLLCFVLVTSCVNQPKKSSFDDLCDVLTDFVNSKGDAVVTREDSEKLSRLIEAEFSVDAPVMHAYYAVASAAPQKKYWLFKQAAEDHIGKPWECKAMKVLNDHFIKAAEVQLRKKGTGV